MFQTRGFGLFTEARRHELPRIRGCLHKVGSGGLYEVRHDLFAEDAHIVDLAVEPPADRPYP
jgi:hypothetical protein